MAGACQLMCCLPASLCNDGFAPASVRCDLPIMPRPAPCATWIFLVLVILCAAFREPAARFLLTARRFCLLFLIRLRNLRIQGRDRRPGDEEFAPDPAGLSMRQLNLGPFTGGGGDDDGTRII